ncbi:glycoside hydrolase family 3 C-terminal domain-containing protein [candidate division KSB1 bacterium]|nr:glycoside hydrolase family 3 C-terminal domain-containing protein [candidate division KSB1 bacterium]
MKFFYKKTVIISEILYLFTVILLFSSTGCKKDKRIYQDTGQPVENQIEELLSRMTLEEKVSMCHANTKFSSTGVPRLGIPSLAMSDGPHGVREEIKPHSWESAGWTNDSCSYFPTLTALAATWNVELAKQYGGALGQEARARNKDVILGPGINIIRTPICGRNFEYMSEDPFLIAEMVVPYIRGMQEQDVAACVKHYALNNQEVDRGVVDVQVDERALREIYLPGFEAAVKQGGVLTVMGAYNKYLGLYCCNNDYLLNKILKEEWGFKGAVISDWSATHNTVESANAGLDIEMGTDKDYNDFFFADPLIKAVRNGQVAEEVVNDKVRRILRVMFRTNVFGKRSKGSFNTPEHQQIALKVAEEAIVLLKNNNSFLPLNMEKLRSVAVIGDNATRVHASGGMSSGLKALYEVTPLLGLENLLDSRVKINYALGYKKTSQFTWDRGIIYHSDPAEETQLLQEAVAIAKKSDAAIIFAGLNHDFDTEMLDRPDMKLPYAQNKLIDVVYKVNPNTVVVLICGSPVEMDLWIDKAPAVLQAWYAGMEGGNAMARILFGEVNPSGKLPYTIPEKLADSPAHSIGEYPGEKFTVKYKEGLLVGYRFFDTNNIEPLYCFGHGLSYTRFEYSDLDLSGKTLSSDDSLHVSLKIKNTGNVDGAEVVQLYIHDGAASVFRPLKELKGFKKVFCRAGEEKKVIFTITKKYLTFYDINSSDWTAEPGMYGVLIGSSSRDIRLKNEFEYKDL